MLRSARAERTCLFVGIDPVADNLVDSARAATRNNVPNALFVLGSAERMPAELDGCADRVTVLFPWGSLLRGIVEADPQVLAGISRLARPGATLDVLLNASVLEDALLCERLGLSRDLVRVPAKLTAAYAAAGIRIEPPVGVTPPLPYVTSWGQRLTNGTRRSVLSVRGVVA